MVFIWIGIYFVYFGVLMAIGSLLQHVLPINDIALQVVAMFVAFGLSDLTIRWFL